MLVGAIADLVQREYRASGLANVEAPPGFFIDRTGYT